MKFLFPPINYQAVTLVSSVKLQLKSLRVAYSLKTAVKMTTLTNCLRESFD